MGSPHLQSGRRLGSYELGGLLGIGGMGEVYRARDTRLGREVAIKILPPAFTSDGDRLARFEREAHVLASLNHSHIEAIYGVEESDGVRALVLELVEGKTLEELIAERRTSGPAGPGLPIDEALAIARQIADALDAAHEKGIVHRDLKPGNIKITPDGVVKVLDFGLAKAAADGASADLTHSPTLTAVNTRDGMLLGTAAYMSLEQARGKAVDRRADIWAFGCVLYEMLTGRQAFGRDTITDTLAAIVEGQPDWTVLPASTPFGIRRLLSRCLEKDPRRRMRDIGDARADLDEMAPVTPGAATDATRRGNRAPWLVAGAAGLVAVALAWVSMSSPRQASPAADDAPEFSRIVPLTAGPAREFAPAVSPDGKWVAYISDAGGAPNVWVRFLAGGEAVNLTSASALDISTSAGIGGLEISPDGTRIAVMAKPRGATAQFDTWEIPAPLPGLPRKLLDTGFLGMRWSQDGTRTTFIRAGSSAGDALWVADGDGSNRREIIPARDGIHIHWPSWSSDGRIYFIRVVATGFNLDQAELYRVGADGGDPEAVVSTLRRAMHPLAVPGGGLIYSANPATVDLGLWWRSADGTATRRLTQGLGNYMEPRISADGRVLVATRYENRQSLVRIAVSGPQPGLMTPISDGFRGDLDPSTSPSADRMVFSSTRAGERHLWSAALDGSDARPLTAGAGLDDDRPALSPDGQQVAFVSDRGGRRGIWLLSSSGGSPRRLIEVSPLGGLKWSRDGGSLLYPASAGEWPGLWSVSVSDGQARRIPTAGAVGEADWNPTRDLIAYLEPATSGPGFVGLAFVSPEGEPQYASVPRAPAISAGFANGMLAWAPDGRSLAAASQVTNGVSTIWLVNPESAAPFRKLVELPPGPRIRGMTWTRDGSALIVGLLDTTSDIVLMDRGQ